MSFAPTTENEMRHCYGDITSPKQVKVYPHSDRADWAEIVSYRDRDHYHLRYFQADNGYCCRSYATEEWIAAHLAEFNGLYEEIKNGDTVTITKDGIPVTPNNSHYDLAVCAALGSLIGNDDFSGYEHNYEIRDNLVYDEA